MICANVAIVGAGAAGLAAACRLRQMGVDDVLVLAEDLSGGTSRGAGSDKQTYYCVATSGQEGDVSRYMAEALFSGGAMHGEHALIEAALSQRCFFYLVEAGVPFPCDEYGQFPGYRTDHDTKMRGSSAGPLTSRYMAECLHRQAERLGVSFLDGRRACAVLRKEGRAAGLVLANEQGELETLCCGALILATGGPGLVYGSSVFPHGQSGALGMALEAGAEGRNLSEWQYGLASLDFRWNLSGTYQQVFPRYVACDAQGNEREIPYLEEIFFKGYQWPFDARRAEGGSSRVDIWVMQAMQRGEKVYLDYRQNPTGFDWQRIPQEAREYLESSGATQNTPFERLWHMNPQAVQLYRSHGIDLETERLRIGVCAQHCNGGIAVDEHWQSTVPGLYVIGEAAGTHGVYRPGGSALNAGQVGALRAAEHIAGMSLSVPQDEQALLDENEELMQRLQAMLCREAEPAEDILSRIQAEMDAHASILRDREGLKRNIAQMEVPPRAWSQDARDVFVLRDLAIAAKALQSAMLNAMEHGVESRGSYLCLHEDGSWQLDNDRHAEEIQQIAMRPDGSFACSWHKRHPLPDTPLWFENVWREYRRRVLKEE